MVKGDWPTKGGPEGSIATIPRTSSGRALPIPHPDGPAAEYSRADALQELDVSCQAVGLGDFQISLKLHLGFVEGVEYWVLYKPYSGPLCL